MVRPSRTRSEPPFALCRDHSLWQAILASSIRTIRGAMILIGLLLGAGEQNLQLMAAGHRVEIRALAPEQLGKAGEGQ